MGSFGDTLRKERELRGVSLREIADATKISVRFLDALEHDRLEILPGGIFRRAFVRQYAHHLGLDAERLVEDFVTAHPDEARPRQTVPPSASHDRTHPGSALLLALVAVGLLLSVLKLTGSQQAPEEQAVASPPPTAAAPVADDQVYPPPVSPRATPAPVEEGLVLTMQATQACWVEVKLDGETVLNRVMTEGESQTLEARGEILLSVGNAGGIRFSVNDRQGLPLGDSGEVRRNIRITKHNLATLLEDPAAMRPASQSS